MTALFLRLKPRDKDGYNAIQLVSIENNLKVYNVNKPQRKIFTSLDIKPKRVIKEFRVFEENILKVGTTYRCLTFSKKPNS